MRSRSQQSIQRNARSSVLRTFETLENRYCYSAEELSLGGVSKSDSVSPSAEGEFVGSYRQNTTNRFDVNRDGVVAPIDVLLVINAMNRFGTVSHVSSISPSFNGFVDVNGDYFASPVDALQVVNYLKATSRIGPFPTRVDRLMQSATH